ncbi:MAG: beta-1,4-mannosyl-glycoprotein beta-1,4-N-acetylglucosaminyltransferase [Proteobacteria bacterium]|nr:beta-1,4-mannosyl-glycoprotein beta-1,4-N-acetylglucosaminyltransferase [Pseudomonadota bacterium]
MAATKIYDCFCYFDEDLILELRFETLWNVVDYFVISEAAYSHAGTARPLHFDIDRFAKYKDKIRYLPLHERPAGENNSWKNENFIRNNLARGLDDAGENDLILISDLDEIPNPARIAAYDPRYLRGDFEQRYYSYYFNNYRLGEVDEQGKLIPGSQLHQGSKITTFRHFRDFFGSNASSVRIYKSSGLLRSLRRSWFRRFQRQVIADGGWHFTWIYDMDGIIRKIENTAHQEFNTPLYKNPERIREFILSGRDFHIPNSRYQVQPLDEQFPAYLLQQRERFKDFLAVVK